MNVVRTNKPFEHEKVSLFHNRRQLTTPAATTLTTTTTPTSTPTSYYDDCLNNDNSIINIGSNGLNIFTDNNGNINRIIKNGNFRNSNKDIATTATTNSRTATMTVTEAATTTTTTAVPYKLIWCLLSLPVAVIKMYREENHNTRPNEDQLKKRKGWRERERERTCGRMEELYLTGLSQSTRSFTTEDFIHLVCFISVITEKSIQFFFAEKIEWNLNWNKARQIFGL